MKVKAKMQEFLEDTGYELGYNESIMPKVRDIDVVVEKNIPLRNLCQITV